MPDRLPPEHDLVTPWFLQEQFTGLRDDVREIHHALFGDDYRPGLLRSMYGDGKGEKGLVNKVDTLVSAAERRNWAFKSVLWLGGGLVGLLTALGQLRGALTALWGHLS